MLRCMPCDVCTDTARLQYSMVSSELPRRLAVALLALSGGMGLGDAHHGPEQPPTRPAESGRAAANLLLPLTWHASDGDSRLRLADYVMNLFDNRNGNGGWCVGSSRIDHQLMLLHIPKTAEGPPRPSAIDAVQPCVWSQRERLLRRLLRHPSGLSVRAAAAPFS